MWTNDHTRTRTDVFSIDQVATRKYTGQWRPRPLGPPPDFPVDLHISPGAHPSTAPARTVDCIQTSHTCIVLGDGVITHGQRGTNRPPLGAGGYELRVKDPNLGIMAKVSYGSWT